MIFIVIILYMQPTYGQSARFILASDKDVSVKLSMPISGYSQSFFAAVNTTLPANDTLNLSTPLSHEELCSIDLVVNDRYLKVMLFSGDSVIYSFNNDHLSITGTNSEGHKLYLEKVVGNFLSMPTNLILQSMNKTRNFENYDQIINSWLIYPFNDQIDTLVASSEVDKRFAEAAKIDNINNIYCFIYNELIDARIAASTGKKKKQLTALSHLIEQNYLTMSAEEAARYPQGNNYSYTKSKLEFSKLPTSKKEALLSSYSSKIPESLSYLSVLPRELLALRLLTAYMGAESTISMVKAYGGKESDVDNLVSEYQNLYNYLTSELLDTEALKNVEL